MGAASAGPLFAYLPKEKRTHALNLDTLETTEVRWSTWGNQNAYGPLTMRTSPDGTLLVGHGGGWAGCEMAIFDGGTQKGTQKIPFWSFNGSFALPSADSQFVLVTGGKRFDRSIRETKIAGLDGAFLVPAIEPGYFLALANQSRHDAPGNAVPDDSLAVFSDERKLLFYVRGLDELKSRSDMSWEKRVHYYPKAGLLIGLNLVKNQVVLRPVRKPDQKD